jgi:hypothetical protein
MGRKFTTQLENWEDSEVAMPARLLSDSLVGERHEPHPAVATQSRK